MEIRKISDYIWEIPVTAKEGMLVPARIYATEKLLGEMDKGVFRAGYKCSMSSRDTKIFVLYA